MADNNMKTTTKKVNGNFFARAGELLGKGLGEYFESATPSAYSIVNELKTTPKEIAELFTTTTQSLTTKYNQFIRLPLFRNISGWFYKEAQSYENDEEDLDFDGLDDEENAEGAAAAAQMSEAKQNTNQLSKVIIQSIGKSVEANNVALSAQKDLIEKQTNVISSGFDAVNNTLKSLTEIITKNSATLIESSVAGSSGGSDVTEDPRKKLLTQGFDASDYKELIKQNFNDLDSSGFMGIVHDFITGSKEDLEEMMSAENIAKIGIPWLIEKIAPNLEDELGNFDKILSDSITSGLIKLGAQASDDSPMGLLGKIFGIDTSRQNVANEKSQLSLQSIPWDTVAKSALTNAIPGYLRKILVQLGGDDLVFDYRSGSFRSEKAIKREFEQSMIYNTMDNLGDSDKRIRDKFDTNDAAQNKSNQMLYSMLLTKLSADMDDGTAQDDLKNMTSIAKARQYVNKMVDGVIDVDENLQKQMDEFARGLYNVTRDTNARNAMTDQAAKNEVLRQEHGNEYVKNAKAMDINLHNWQDSVLSEQKTIARMFDANVVKKSQTDSSNQIKAPKKRGATEYLEFLSTQVGAYISEAVYRIWHRLDTGINVYQVGSGSLANSPFEPDTSSLVPPGSVLQFRETKGDVPVTKNDTSNAGGKKANQPEYDRNIMDSANLFENQVGEDLSVSERIDRGTENLLNNIVDAAFSGKKGQLSSTLAKGMQDITQSTVNGARSLLDRINKSTGNITGHIHHLMTGAPYEYTNDEGETVRVEKNDKGGAVGLIKDKLLGGLEKGKDLGKKIWSGIQKTFDFGGGTDDKEEDPRTQGEKKRAITGGALAGAGLGILGGPIGMLAGSIAGAGIGSSKKITDTLMGKLFGRYQEDDGKHKKGDAKGIFTKLGDTIFDPIKFQINKTATIIGHNIKTKIADKIQDFGTALKDRITSHVDRGFTRFMKKVGGILFKPFELLGKGIGKVFKGIGTGLFNLGARTGPGMAGFFARRAVNGVLNPVSGILGGSAALLRINTFHILKNGEKHWLVVGDEYFNPAEAEKLKEGLDPKQKKNFDNRKAVHRLKNPINQDLIDYYPNESFKIEEIKDTESKIDGKDGVLLVGNGSKNYPRPTANDFHRQLKSRRKLENQKFKEALKSKSFKTWRREHHLEKMSEAEAAKQYMAEKEAKEKKEAEEKQDKDENKQTVNNIDTNVEKIADGIDKISGATQNMDQRDAEIIAQQKEEAEKAEAGSPTAETEAEKKDREAEAVQQQAQSASQMANDQMDSQNAQALERLQQNAASENPDPKQGQEDLSKITKNEADKQKEEERPEKNRKTIFEKMGDMFSNMGGLSGLGNLLGGGLTSLLPGIIVGGLAIGFLTKFLGDPSGTVSGVFNNIKGAFSNLMGFIKGGDGSPLNAVTSLADMQVDNTAELGLPVGTIDHVTTDAAGNTITNQAATQARNTFSQHAITDYFTRNQLARNSIWKERVANARQWKYQGWSFNDKYVDQALRMNPEMTSQEFGQMLANNGVPYDEIAASTQKFNQAKDTLNTNRYIGSDDIAEYNAANPDKNKGGGFNSNTAIKMAAATGVTAAVSGGAGFLTSSVAKGFGASDETAGMVDRGTQVLTSGAMMQNMAKNMMKDPVHGMDNSWVGKIINGLEKLVNGIKEKAIQKWPQMAEKVGGGFSKIQGFVKGINAKILEPFKNKINNALMKAGINGGLGAISGGVLVAAGAVMGIINGVVSTEHLFGVLPGDATPQMRTISALLGSAMGALSAVPAISFVVACIDVIDMVFKTIAGKGLMQMIAEAMMNATPEGAQDLAEAQGRMQAELDAYNEKFGTSMDVNTYNDMVNNANLGQAMWEGNIKKNEDGSIYYDEAGAVVRTGMKNMFVGSEKLYAHDANGNLIRDAEGNAVQAMDAYGNTLMADDNWGNKVGQFFHTMGTKVFGGDIYETDENGQAIIDPETGQPVKKGQEMGFFESLGRGLFGGDAYERNEDGSIKVDPVTGERIVKDDTRQINGFERFGTNISSVWTGLFGSKEEKEALAQKIKSGTLYERTKEEDEANREKVMRVMDPKYAEKEWGPEGEESKAGKSGDVKNKAITGSEVTTDEEGNTIRTETKADGSKVVTTTRKDGSSYTTYYKPNGEIELKIGSGDKEKNMGEIVTGSLGGVFGSVIKNVRDITEGVEKWNKEKAPWGTEDPAKYMSDEVQGFYDGVLGPVNDLIKNTVAKMGKLLNVNVTSNTSSGNYTYDVNSETGFSDTEGYSYNGSDSVTDTFVDQYGLERRLPSGYSEKNGVVYDSRGNKVNTNTFEIVNLPSGYSQKNGNIYDSRGNKVNPEALGGKLNLPSGYSEKNGKVYDRQGHEVDRNAFRVSNTALTSTGSVKYSTPIGPQPQSTSSKPTSTTTPYPNPTTVDQKIANNKATNDRMVSWFTNFDWDTTPEDKTWGIKAPKGSPGEWGIGGDESVSSAISQLSNIGKSFLNEISGGLFGDGTSSEDTININVDNTVSSTDTSGGGGSANLYSEPGGNYSDSPLSQGYIPAQVIKHDRINVSRITIHHMAGKMTAQSCCQFFSHNPTNSNYCIGYDGSIMTSVHEADRSICSSSTDNDRRAITIEVSNSENNNSNWPVTDISLQRCIDLCVDICKRYGKNKLVYLGSRSATDSYNQKSNEMLLTRHDFYKQKVCPGPYLGSKFPYIVQQVNAKLGSGSPGRMVDNLNYKGSPDRLIDSISSPSLGMGAPDDISKALGAASPLGQGATISSPFGNRPELGDYHKGLDLVPGSDDRVQSTVEGKVISVKKGVSDSDTGIDYKGKNASGNEVIIQGNDGLLYRNSHMKDSSIPSDLVPGKSVKRGDKLGTVGSTGRSSGKHLHYEVAVPGAGGPISINPLSLGKGSPTRKSRKSMSKALGMGAPNTFAKALPKMIRKGIGAAEEMVGPPSPDFNKWIQICQSVKEQYSTDTYSTSGNTISVQYGGRTIQRRPDCSGYVSACITFFSGKDYNTDSGSMVSDTNAAAYGFERAKFPGWGELWEGDVLITDGHLEIFYGSVDGNYKSWTVGDRGIKDAGPGAANVSRFNTSNSWIWRPKCSTGQRIDVNNVVGTNGGGNISADGSVEVSQETGLAGVLGQLKNVGATFLNEISGGLFGSVDGSSSTTTDVSSVGSNIASGTGDFKKYSLTDSEITGLANIVGHEQGDRAGKYAEASLIANQADMHNQTPVQRATSGWFADGAARMKKSDKADADAIAAVKDVIIGGKRTLPGYVDEHDCWSDIASVTGGGGQSNKAGMVPHQTVIRNNMGSTWKFFTFPGGPNSGNDPFGYTSDDYRAKVGEDFYNVGSPDDMDLGIGAPDDLDARGKHMGGSSWYESFGNGSPYYSKPSRTVASTLSARKTTNTKSSNYSMKSILPTSKKNYTTSSEEDENPMLHVMADQERSEGVTNTKIDAVIQVMQNMVNILGDIRTNTGDSNELLDSLNRKDLSSTQTTNTSKSVNTNRYKNSRGKRTPYHNGSSSLSRIEMMTLP